MKPTTKKPTVNFKPLRKGSTLGFFYLNGVKIGTDEAWKLWQAGNADWTQRAYTRMAANVMDGIVK